jgi:hypothetical protein
MQAMHRFSLRPRYPLYCELGPPIGFAHACPRAPPPLGGEIIRHSHRRPSLIARDSLSKESISLMMKLSVITAAALVSRSCVSDEI